MVAWREEIPTEVLLYDLEIERAVLGFCLLDLEAFEETVDLLQPESFYLSAHQQVYAACVALYYRGDAVDQDTVTNELRQRQQLDEAGGVDYLTQLASTTETWDEWEGHAQAVADYALRRRLLALSIWVAGRACDLAVHPKQVREELQAGLAELQQEYDGPGLRPFA